jgi:energy-converting hydrogenase Eha subunit C
MNFYFFFSHFVYCVTSLFEKVLNLLMLIILQTGMIHIIASNELDAAFAQGFVSAQVQLRIS